MPTLHNLPDRKRVSDKRQVLDHISVYNTQRWKRLRLNYLKQCTLCEVCLADNKIVLAEDVHHKVYLSTASTKEGKQVLGFDVNNLQAVCKDCHKKIHNRR